MSFLVEVRVKTQNESNGPQANWGGRAKRRKDQRLAVWAAMREDRLRLMELKSWPRWRVTLTRLAPSSGLDDDGLRTSLKSVRDEVTKQLGVGRWVTHHTGPLKGQKSFRENDRDPRIQFHYKQERAAHYTVFVRFEIGGAP